MGKLKVHELAKELGLTSKELIEKIEKMGFKIKSHMSILEDEQVNKIRKELKAKTEDVHKKTGPVIIRRAVILEDEKQRQDEKIKQRPTPTASKEGLGVVERRKNNEYNIVYRNRPTKPKTMDELFGKPKQIKETEVETKASEEPVETPVTSEVVETVKTDEPISPQQEAPQPEAIRERSPETRNFARGERRPYTPNNQGQRPGFSPRPGGQNNRPYNNQNRPQQGYNRPYTNNQNNQGQRPGFSPNNQGQRPGFSPRPGGQNRNFGGNRPYGQRPMDGNRLERNIKDIMSEATPSEQVREFGKGTDKDKQKNKGRESKFYEDKSKNRNIRSKGSDSEIDAEKLKDLRQEKGLNEDVMLNYYDISNVRARKNRRKPMPQMRRPSTQKIFELKEITIPSVLTVKELAESMKKTSSEIIKKLLSFGIMATLNNEIDFDTAYLVAEEFGITANKQVVVTEEDILFDDTEDDEKDLKQRPPVVVVMGHVDHGKTSLLDAVRKANVIEREAGGITQHIGAYKVKINNKEITFLDTPGHEAFTSMRARGAQITDVAILVVAANDGVMPQTIEAINHAKAADIPIIVAINKIDVEGANPEKIKQELTEHGLVTEEWGGDTIMVEISAKKRVNIENLLEMVLLVADMKELKANPKKQAKGTVIEAKLDKNRGPVATLLVQRGTLDSGDTILVGSAIGRVRAMFDDKGAKVKKAGPSTPVEITGLTEVPEAGETFYEVKDEKTAKHLVEKRKIRQREEALGLNSKITLEQLFKNIESGTLKDLNLIIKADVQGSVEAVKQSLEKIQNEEVKVRVIHANVGGITESDVKLANASNAIIIGFNVRPMPVALAAAEKEGVEIKLYSVIYHAIEDIEAAMKGMLTPTYKETILGSAEVRAVFKASNIGTIAGCYVTDGKVERNSTARVIRDDVVIYEGKLESLKREKDDAKEVASGYECGIKIENFNDIKEGDRIESFIMEEIK